jgi:hypothetical protein
MSAGAWEPENFYHFDLCITMSAGAWEPKKGVLLIIKRELDELPSDIQAQMTEKLCHYFNRVAF